MTPCCITASQVTRPCSTWFAMSFKSSTLSCSGRTETETTMKRQGYVSVLVALLLVAICDVTCASSDFYYDNWQCNNYLSAESVVIQAAAGHLLEIHIRDDIPVSTSQTHNIPRTQSFSSAADRTFSDLHLRSVHRHGYTLINIQQNLNNLGYLSFML